ncbi:hypothetical protein SAMN05518672_103461 [Chitinophaga sp. CF118]|uniref:hypothetical protein n=1 Tax=Chitinophaga sp. CF118 TaxID=1884367 RepID=UPI0008F17ADB|nr:hypothetical protein [Chitinophaga sp. CF118]SFD84131.1 hypothetical protein SAMN05518672_103461 [Chitinophaga sp. CF118]
MIDEAFLPFRDLVDKILDIPGANIVDEESGIHSFIYEIEIGTPIELDISVDDEGKVKIGSVPPLYRVNSSFRPSYHSITIKAEKYTPPENGE